MKKLLKKRFVGPVNNARDPLVWLGVSTSPYHLTNSPDPPETDRPSLEPTNPTVGNGSPPTELKPFGSVCGFPPQKPEPPNLTITSTSSGYIQRFADKKWQISAIFLLFQRRSTWNPPNPTRFGDISSRSSPDSMDPTKYRPDLTGSNEISASMVKLETDRHKPENRWTQTGRPDH